MMKGFVVALAMVVALPGTSAQNYEDHDYVDFVPNLAGMTCTNDKHTYPFNNQLRGVNLGGWLVLEPWITPSLFYQFLGKDEGETAMDIHGFCEVLGPKEANRQLRAHWANWLTEAHIQELSAAGVNSLRLPVGDWMYEPYGAYRGCTDGALEQVDWLLNQAHAVGLSVLFDIHGVQGSQNGFDNSGKGGRIEWTSNGATQPLDVATFSHWSIREAEWMGEFNAKSGLYNTINYDNINKTLRVIGLIADRYKDHPAVLGLEPVNEPWQFTPMKLLKQFYFDGYLEVKKRAPQWKYIMHDSFRFTADVWGGFMRGCPDIALDTHIYQAWKNPGNPQSFYLDGE
jgi:glucan 1,3-beta-glucosidase